VVKKILITLILYELAGRATFQGLEKMIPNLGKHTRRGYSVDVFTEFGNKARTSAVCFCTRFCTLRVHVGKMMSGHTVFQVPEIDEVET
jgi:hypothetical protein